MRWRFLIIAAVAVILLSLTGRRAQADTVGRYRDGLTLIHAYTGELYLTANETEVTGFDIYSPGRHLVPADFPANLEADVLQFVVQASASEYAEAAFTPELLHGVYPIDMSLDGVADLTFKYSVVGEPTARQGLVLLGPPGPDYPAPIPYSLDLIVNVVTGEVVVSVDGGEIEYFWIGSVDGGLLPQDATPGLLSRVGKTSANEYSEGGRTVVDGEYSLGLLYDVQADTRDLWVDYGVWGHELSLGADSITYVPEPSSFFLVAAGGGLLMRRSRRAVGGACEMD